MCRSTKVTVGGTTMHIVRGVHIVPVSSIDFDTLDTAERIAHALGHTYLDIPVANLSKPELSELLRRSYTLHENKSMRKGLVYGQVDS